MKQQLSLDTIGDLDAGTARHVIDAALQAMMTDIEDRGDDHKARKTTIIIEAKQLDNGQIAVHVDAKTSVPAYRTHDTFCLATRANGRAGLAFQSLAPDAPHQNTLDEYETGYGDGAEPKTRKDRRK